jgi:hypothetical protein
VAVLLIGAAVALAYGVYRSGVIDETVQRLLMSTTASRLGIDNQPDETERRRLRFLAEITPGLLAIAKEVDPNAYIGSGFRNEELNKAVGGSPRSWHRIGLAEDISGVGGLQQTVKIAQAIRARDSTLPRLPTGEPAVRTVIAEVDHVHIAINDPLGEFPPRVPTRYLEEKPGAAGTEEDPRFITLRK